jgi:hypothetical protein
VAFPFSRASLAVVAFLGLAISVPAQVKIAIDHNGTGATGAFKFKDVPSPVKDNAATRAKLILLDGEPDGNSAELSALTDGVLPEYDDQPAKNFFFAQGTGGGRFAMDLGSIVEIAQVNTYSWHPNTRGPQVYKLYVSDGSDPKFNTAPKGTVDPATCGWKLLATVDTRPREGGGGGQYGVSISDAGGSLGKIRYLLFDVYVTEADDDWGNTFYSEVNVIEKK